ncbi:MAG TPA: ABC transporter substrate-binding protein [Microthrixaceae bacterium]|nr:ABC transporter substrate-binding protein [Microthrixaceae bacterium]
MTNADKSSSEPNRVTRSPDGRPARPSLMARFGPLTVILVAISLAMGMASFGHSSSAGAPGNRVSGSNSTGSESSSESELPISYPEARAAGTTSDYDWGADCDTTTGRVKIPSVFAAPCVVARPEVNRPGTTQGVTADTIKVVAYQYADDDLSAVLQSNMDPPELQGETLQRFVELLTSRMSTWGRKIEIVPLKGSGSDETSSRADAVKVATEIGAFASLGGPGQQGAYAEELAHRGVICIGCGLSVPDSTFQANAPYMWGTTMTPEQYLTTVGDYLFGRLLNRPAEFAGDPKMRSRKRVFGSVQFEQDPPVFDETKRILAERGAKVGYKSAAAVTYQLVIPELAEKARSIVTQMKEAGVTTVLFFGDPIMPIYLTQAATGQNYFPEWVITGTVLTDTTVFGRMYDQAQWAHAFGLSNLAARLPLAQSESWKLHRWYFGENPSAEKTAGVLFEPVRILLTGIHMAGPVLTPETFRDGMFSIPPTGGTPTKPQMSFGNHGFFSQPDYLAFDDMTEIWWDAKAAGPDEQGVEGTGMLRYVDGGRRYLGGELPTTVPDVFNEEGSVAMYAMPLPEEKTPEYQPER